jgi:hypothetical protein
MNLNDFQLVENRFSQYDNLSAIVVNLSGIASYPSIVSNDYDLYRSISVIAHEWTHQCLFFYPLGRAYFDEGIGREMNETVADMVGYEVADRIYRRYGCEPPPWEGGHALRHISLLGCSTYQVSGLHIAKVI